MNAHHGQLPAVRNVSLHVHQGEILALVGANGAGKTTLLRTLAGAHRASGGTVWWDGEDITGAPAHQRVSRGLALVPEGRRLFASMTVRENLLVARAAGRRGQWGLDTVLDAFPQLRPKLDARAGDLSGGQQQAVAIGRALMTNPRLLLLDEVSLGLSPLAVQGVYDALRGVMGQGTTLVLVEQDLQRVQSVASRIVCMLEGRVVTDAPADQLTRAQITAHYFGAQRPESAPGTHSAAANTPRHAQQEAA
ncbi:branched-chain amino acid transport system ATP-binding protein [Acidovorax soli]|uniref:Branched-chain amino acid transport system ATP-binding protein n=1 Tax=Acidovorax soli TaxID=592050 RepID=A0A7X0PCK3_9BURK|nr:ABC transporter ATP-binding protein [Acidovorax soli]MBB6559314.1 branched-chain amino acid transport system ATP-binding protein [Acidovorax soli]